MGHPNLLPSGSPRPAVSSVEEHAPSSLGVVNVVADGGAATPGGAAPLLVELQVNNCNSVRYRSEEMPRCTACIKKISGESCRFQRLRYLLRETTGRRKVVGFSFGESQAHASPALDMPNKWNTDLLPAHIERVKVSILWSLGVILADRCSPSVQ